MAKSHLKLVTPTAQKRTVQMIIFAAQKMPDGSIVAPAINVGRDGAAPPM
jgi:hypothetical protein